MKYRKLLYFLQNIGKDPDTLVLEDERTGFGNRRRLFHFFEEETDWRDLARRPICLLMIGIDDLKRINEQYGGQTGDELVVHTAEIMKSLAAEKDLLIRYSADEFIMLLPGKNKQDGMASAETLVAAFEENPFFSAETGMPIPVSIAVGVACAPDDADHGNLLVNRADTALYHARKDENRNIIDASDAGRLAIRSVHSAGIVGRKAQFDIVSVAFKDLGKGKNQFFIIDGEPGMGKTSFIDAVQRNLEKTRLNPVRINGVVQETYRPYYLVSYAVIALMNQCDDKGIGTIESTGKEDLACLLHIIPQLTDENQLPAPGGIPGKTENVFNALNRFLAKLLKNRPFILLIDDFQLADPASLDIFRELIANGKSPAFICATASIGTKEDSGGIPLSLFRTAYSESLDIKNISLNPLTRVDIQKYFNLLFPGIELPEGLAEEISGVTGGSPLFLVALIIKMIEEKKILQSDGQWTVVDLGTGYFPESLEQIIKEKLAGLNMRDKQFIDQVSAFGESASLSMLEGFTRQESYQVYEIIKEAVDHGLMRQKFSENDENISFSSKLVREVIYERMGEEERKRLHEEIGLYHEKLYFQNVLPSAAFLVHHFKQSDNLEKAGTYDQLMAKYNKAVYDPEIDAMEAEEAEPDDGEGLDTEHEIAVKPMSKAGLETLPEMLHTLVISIRNLRLYPDKSKTVTTLTERLMRLSIKILKTNERFSIIVEKNMLIVNSQQVDTASFSAAAAKIVELWNRLELKSLTIKRGVTEKETTAAVRQISRMEKSAVTPGFWRRFARENHLVHIIPTQIRYTQVSPDTGTMTAPSGSIAENTAELPKAAMADDFDDNEVKTIQRIISAMLSAYNKIKLYPSRGRVATKAVLQLVTELHAFLRTWPVFTISRVDNRLLVNGIKLDTKAFENLAEGLLKLLAETGLNSISFTGDVNANEVVDFLKAACQVQGENPGPDFWQQIAAQHQINGILFNQSIYDILTEDPGEEETAEDQAIKAFDLEDLPAQARDLYLKGDIRGLEAILNKATELYLESEDTDKLKIIHVFEKILFPEDWHPSAAYIKLVTNHVLRLVEAEEASGPLENLFDLCHQCTRTFILFGEYTFASWIYTRAGSRFADQMPEKKEKDNISKDAGNIHVLGRPLEPRVTEAIAEDLQSGDRFLQQEAYQLVSSMGPGMIPLLIDIITASKDLRVRRLAAELINKRGKEGAHQVKSALLNAWRPEQKCRILDVIDTVTTDIAGELAAALSDPDENVRRRAFKIAERINTTEAVALIKNCALSRDSNLAILAINSLARLKPDFLPEILAKILRESTDPDTLIAGCRAMGQAGDPAYISPLSDILFPKRRFFRRKKYDAPVRVAAAFAMAQIPGEKADSILQSLGKDPDPKIREVVSRYYPEDRKAQS